MSHVVTVETRFTDLAALRAAFERIGGQWMEGQKSYRWYGNWMDDSPVPDDLFSPEETARVRGLSRAERSEIMRKALGKCDHAVRFPGASYEVGIVSKADGSYGIRWDFWGSGGLLPKMGDQKASKLVQAYGVEKSRATVKRMGHVVVREQVLANGTVRLVTRAR